MGLSKTSQHFTSKTVKQINILTNQLKQLFSSTGCQFTLLVSAPYSYSQNAKPSLFVYHQGNPVDMINAYLHGLHNGNTCHIVNKAMKAKENEISRLHDSEPVGLGRLPAFCKKMKHIRSRFNEGEKIIYSPPKPSLHMSHTQKSTGLWDVLKDGESLYGPSFSIDQSIKNNPRLCKRRRIAEKGASGLTNTNQSKRGREECLFKNLGSSTFNLIEFINTFNDNPLSFELLSLLQPKKYDGHPDTIEIYTYMNNSLSDFIASEMESNLTTTYNTQQSISDFLEKNTEANAIRAHILSTTMSNHIHDVHCLY